MISVVQALLRRFRRSIIAESVASAVRPRVRMRVEEIEPRILFSSDLAPAVIDQPGTQVQMRVIEAPPPAPSTQTQQATTHELIVVDTATPDYQALIDDIVGQNDDPTRSFEIRLVDGNTDGVTQLTELLSGAGQFDTVHVVSHGIAGGIRLGSSVLNIDTLQARSEEIARWGGALTEDGDMLIYGCDVAGSADGRLLIDALAKLTGADVAASDDTTGSASLGGDWQLEYRQGAIEGVVLAQGAHQSWSGLLANAAPVLSGANPLSTILEDAVGNAGTLVSDLVAGRITDGDAGALAGIAVTAVDTSFGTWQYTTNGGSSWSSLGGVSATSARLLAADANTSVRFVPDANFNGTVANGITFHAWDRTTGTAGGTADTTSVSSNVYDRFSSVSYNNNDGSAAWSTGWTDSDGDPAIGSISITGGKLRLDTSGSATISRQADLSDASSATLSFTYTNSIPLTGGTAQIQIFNAGTGSYDTLATFTSGSNTGSGTISVNIGAYISGTTGIRFVTNSGLMGGAVTVDNVQIVYVTPLTGGSTAFSSALASSSLSITAVNDAPSGSNTTVTMNEDSSFVFTASNFGFSDSTDGGAHTLNAVRIATLPAAGSLTLSGAAVSAGESISVASINAGNLVFTPGLNGNGNSYASFTFQVEDNGGTANGGADTDATPNTMTLKVNSVNDAPAGADNTVTTNEDTAFVFTAASFGLTDTSDSPADQLDFVTITTLPAAGSLTLNGTAVTVNQRISEGNIASGRLVFTPAANAHGSGYASFTFNVQDDGGTGNGGVDTDPTPNTMTIHVTSVSDAPAGTSATLTINEDAPHVFTAANFGFIDAADGNALTDVRITTVPTTGLLTLSGAAVIAGQSISVANINAGNLVFTPVANASGTSYASFTFQVQDDGGTANGGVDLDATPNTLTINVNAVNDAPVGTDDTITIVEESIYTFTTANFGFSDPVEGNTLAGVKITTLPAGGTLTVSGTAVTAGQIVTAANISAGNFVYTPAVNGAGAGYGTFTFQVQDNGGTANGGVDTDSTPNTMTINVTGTQDAPVLTGANNMTVLEDASGNSGTLVSALVSGVASDPDAGAVLGIAVTAVSNSNGTWQYTTNGGTSWTAFGSPTAGSARLLAADANTSVRFVPNANWNGTLTGGLTFRAWDQTAGVNGGLLPTIANPILSDSFSSVSYGNNDGTATWTTNWVDSEDADPTGGRIRVSSNALEIRTNNAGLSVTRQANLTTATAATLSFTYNNQTNTAPGSVVLVQMSNNGGASFTTVGTFSDTLNIGTGTFTTDISAYISSDTQIRFNITGGGSPTRSLFIDNVQIAMTTPGSGGASAFSSATASSNLTVTPVNDAPAGTNNTVTTNEDTGYAFTAANFGFTDPTDSGANTLAAVRITTLPALGTLRLSGVAVSAGDFVSAADIAAGNLVYTPAVNANGTGYTSFTFQVQDNGGTANAGVDLDQSPNTMTVNVTAVNDAPSGTDTTVTTLEDTAYTFTAANFGFTDASDSPANSLSAVKITTLASAGTLTLSGAAVTAGQTITVSNINSGNLRFTPASNGNGNAYAAFTFQVQDSGGTANGGVNLDATPRTMTVNVTAVNDAPVGTNTTVTTNEDTAYTFTAANFGFTDPNDSGANTLSAVRITTLAGAGTLTLSGTAVTAGQSVSVANINAGNLRFTPATNANGTAYTTFTFQVQDNGGTANGGVSLDATPRTLTVNVTPVNDAPVGTNTTVTTNEDTAYTFTAANFGFTDPSDSPANALSAVKITTLATAGTLTLSGAAVSAGQTISVADINSGNLRFTPAANANGMGYSSFTFQAQDSGGTANGGVDLDATPRTLTVNVTAVNDAPVGTNTTVTTLEDTAYTFSAANFGFTDPSDSPGNTLSAVRITTLATAGTLTVSGAAVSAGQSISVADINAGNLVFTPGANGNGAGYASFTFQVQDSGGTANGGANLDATPNTLTLDVTAVNDAPVGTNTTVTTNEDTPYAFSAASFGFTDPSDGSGNALASVRITTVPTVGALTLAGVAVTAGQTIGAASLAAGDLVFTPAANANGAAYSSFTFQIADDGGTANGGVDLDATPRTLTVNVTSVNDAPAGTSATVVTNEDATYTFTGANFGLTDGNDTPANALSAVRITTIPGAGALTLSGVVVSAGQVVSVANINAGNLQFTPAANASGAGYASFTFQVQDDGGTTNGGVDLDPVARTISVDVIAVNDAPAGTDNTVTILEESLLTFATADFGFSDASDSPASNFAAVKITVLPANGTLTLSGSALTAGQFVSFANIAAGNLVYTPGANGAGAGYGSFTFQVQDDGGTANGGVNVDTVARTMTINVTNVNDAPLGANSSVATNEDTPFTFSAASFGFSDVNDAPSNTLGAINIATLPASGALTLGGVAVTAGQWVSVAQLNAGDLVFTPAPNANGAGYESFTFRVQDDGGTANGGVNADASANTMTIDVNAVNDAPRGTDNTLTIAEDTSFAFTTADFGFTDAVEANGFAAVRIASVPAGTLALNGTQVFAGQLVTTVDIAGGQLVYTPDLNANGAGYGTFTFQVQDDGGTASGGANLDPVARTMTINVSSAGDSPVLVGANNMTTILEDAGATAGTLVSDLIAGHATDPDVGSLFGIAVTGVNNANGAWQYSTNGGAAWSNFGSPSQGSARLLAADASTYVRFVPNANWNGTVVAGLTFRAWDQTLGTNGGVAPTISNPVLRDNFAAVSYSNNDGTAAWSSSWVDGDGDASGGAIRVNAGALEISNTAGASIYRQANLTGALTASLSFSYNNTLAAGSTIVVEASSDGGGSFTTLGTFSSAANTGAGVFSANVSAYISTQTQIRFSVTAAGGAARTLAIDNFQIAFTAEGNGGSSAFSTASASSNVTVTPVNDAPVGASATVTTNEDTPFVFNAGHFGLTDPVDAGANALAAVQITSMSGAGALTLNGAAVNAGDFVSVADINLGRLVFTAAPNASGAGYGAFTFQVRDDGGTANGGVDFDPVSRTMTIDVTAVNDAPAGSNNSLTTNEDTPFTFTAAQFGFSDTSDAPANAMTAVRITTLPTAGSLALSGSVLTAGQFVSVADISAGNLVFTPAANANGAAYSTFTFQVQDGGGTANGGADLDPTARTLTLNVTAVNDAPIGTSSTVTAVEDTPFVFSTAAFGLTDPSDSPANNLLSVTISTLPAAGTLTLNGVAVTTGQTVSAASIASGQLVFTAAANATGAGYAAFGFQIRDDGGTANGGADFDAVARTLTIDVAPVNDAPSGADRTVATLEDAAYTFVAADFGFTDAIDSNSLAAVKIATLPVAGTLTLNGAAVTAGQFVTASDITIGRLQFAPAANANGTGYTSFTFQVQDDGGTAAGGVDLDPVAHTLTIDVTAVNDAPVGTNTIVTTLEDTALVFNTAMFGFTDPSDGGANSLSAVAITTLPAAGSLTLNGVAVGAGQVVSAANIVAGRLVYTPAVDGAGAGYASFTFQVQDNGGTANGGANLDTVARTLTIDVTAVNDAPVGANTTVTAVEDTPFVFTTAAFGFSDVRDAPANSLVAVTISSLPAAGTLTLNGVAVGAGQSVSAVDIAAGRLVFTPLADANGAAYASFGFNVQDDGGTANGGADLDTAARTMTIDVTAVNDAPAGADNTIVALEDTPFAFSAADFASTDPSDTPANALGAVRIATLPSVGTLTLGGGAVAVGDVVTLADINAGNLEYTPGLNTSGVGYTSFTFQVRDDGGTANGGADFDPVARTMSVDVIAQNDPPVGTNTTVTVLEDGSRAFTVADFGFTDPADTPADNVVGVRISSLPLNGTLRLNGAAVSAGDFISVANLAAGRLVYAPAANGAGDDYTNFTFQVRDDGGGADLDTVARTMTIDVTAVNDAPVGTSGSVTANEDVTFAFSIAAFGLTDPADIPANGLASVTIVNVPIVGTLALNGVAVTAGQVVTAADIGAGLLTFRGNMNAFGAGYASFTFQVQDDGGTANGGADQDAGARTMTINVNPVNDAPSGTDNTVTTAEDTPFAFTTAMFTITDAADTPANTLFAIIVTSLPGSGALTLSGAAVTANQTILASDIAAGRLVYTPGAHGNGAAYASFSFLAQDNGGVAGGGTNTDTVQRAMTVNVTALNDPPSAADSTISTVVNTAYTFSAASLGYADPADQVPNNLLAVHIVTVPASGALSLDGVLVSAGQLITAADLTAAKFAYVPPANTIQTGAATFSYRLQDDGGGSDTSPTPTTITINIVAPPAGTVAPAAPPPVIIPAPAAPTTPPTNATTLTTAALAPTSVTQQATADARSTTSAQPLPAVTFKELDPNLASTNDASRSAVVQVALQRLDTQPHNESRTTGSEAQAIAIVADRFTDASAASASAQSRAAQSAVPAAENRELFTQANQIRADLREEQKFEAHAMAATAATGVSLSVGFVIWLLRGGALVSTLLSSVPAWRFVDPLPVLGNTAGAEGDFEDDSLESLVNADADDDELPPVGEAKPETAVA